MAIQYDREYFLFEMANFEDEFQPTVNNDYYKFTGTVPSWITTTEFSPSIANSINPQFGINIPQGTQGTFSFGVEHRQVVTNFLLGSGTITINVLLLENQPIVLPHCYKVNLVWLKPSGGWANFIFSGKYQATQEEGKSSTFINSSNEKRFSSKEDVHDGLMVTTGKVSPTSADFIADMHSSIQAWLWDDNGFTPIIIDPQSFEKVRSGESYAEYEFKFMYAVPDVIQTQ